MFGQTSFLSEIMAWSLSSWEISWYQGVEGNHGCAFHDTTGVDIITFAGNLSFEICEYGNTWITVWNKAKSSSLLVLVGAGAAFIYFWRKSLQNDPPNSPNLPPSSPRLSARGFIKWLFEEELVEDGTYDPSHIHGYYFGPSLSENLGQSSSNDADCENDSDDLSLNSLSASSSPCRFLSKPLYNISLKGNIERLKTNKCKSAFNNPVQITNPCPKCEKGTCRLKKHQTQNIFSSSSSCYSGSPKIHTKTPDLLQHSYDDQILQRTVASSRLTYRYYRPGFDLRMRGDGSDEVIDNVSSKLTSGIFSPTCGDPNCTDSQCFNLVGLARDTSIDSVVDQSCSVSGSMLDLVQNAKDVRKLIREVSFDSESSDLELDLPYNLGVSTAEGMDQLCDGLNLLVNNCDCIEGEMASLPVESKLMSSQSSMSGLSELGDEGHIKQEGLLKRESSIPDFRTLQKKARSNKRLWKLTGFSDADGSMDLSEHENASLEWDSPTYGWENMKLDKSDVYYEGSRTDSENEIVSVVGLGVDPWEWDNDCLNESLDADVIGMNSQHAWLPGSLKELDLTLNQDNTLSICASSQTSRSSSRQSSTEKDMRLFGRLPISGRSSLRESFTSQRSECSPTSEDFILNSAKQYPRTRSRSNSNSKLVNDLSPLTNSNFENTSNHMTVSAYSEESGFHDYEGSMKSSTCSMNSSICSMNSSFFTASINLSPVKEANEPISVIESTPFPLNLQEYGVGTVTYSDTEIKLTLPMEKVSTVIFQP